MGIRSNRIKPIDRMQILRIVSLVLTGLFNVVLIATLILAKNYYNLALNASIFLIISLVILVGIIDLVTYVGFRYKDLKLNIFSSSISFLFGIISIVVCIYLITINNTIDKIIDNTGTEQYETISVTLACYKDDYSDIEDCKNKKIGILSETEVGTASIFKEKAQKENLTLNYAEYNTTSDLFFALITDEIDVGVFPSNYRMLYKDDEESDFSDYLKDVKDFYSFEENVKTGDNALANADLTLEPFNVLLIGFAPEEGSNGKYGLADSIIVATINPQTLEVGLTSIARDSYVPISCYSGYRDKINAARGKSRQCLMDTVGELLDLDIDLYMEVNFKAVVEIVDAVGGIDINSPVAFTGQTSSEVRGTYTIQIPQGYYHANGEEALAYARERHAMPAGDFDRQEHQKEVIARVVEKILDTRDINTITNIIKACGNNLSTNLSIQQITQFFNYVVGLKNNTTLALSALVDMQNARLTGYSSWYYNYSAHLPLWIYKLYNGSVEEAKKHINDIITGHHWIYKENECAKFFSYYAYERPKWYHTFFNESYEEEEMPAFYKNLVGMSYSDLLDWANANGVVVNLNMILPGDPGYDESIFGQVIDQSVSYGSLVSENPSVTITIMGDVTGSVSTIPNFVGKGYSNATSWCSEHNISCNITWVDNSDISKGGTISTQSVAPGTISSKITSIDIQVYKYPPIPSDALDVLQSCVGIDAVNNWSSTYGYTVSIAYETTDIQADDGIITNVVANNPGTAKSTVTVTMNKYESVPSITCPIGSTGDYPSCDCGDGYTYDPTSNTCIENTTTTTTCPLGSTGDYPSCDCGAGYTYDPTSNTCIENTTTTDPSGS